MPRASCVPPWTPAEHDIGHLSLAPAGLARGDWFAPSRHPFVGGEHTLPHRWQEKDVDQVRIEQSAATFEENLARIFDGATVAVLPAVSNGVEGIGDGDDARREGNAATLEATRIS